MAILIKNCITNFVLILFCFVLASCLAELVFGDNGGGVDHPDSCNHVESKRGEFGKLLLLSRDKRQTVQCPSSWTPHGTNCYMATKAQIDQPTAEVNCRDNGGHLASVSSTDENTFVQSLANSLGTQSIWLGLRYEDNIRWKWLNQGNSSYTNWNDGQPANPSSQRCVILNSYSSGRWETRQCFPATADGYACITTPTGVTPTSGGNPCSSSPCLNGGYCQADGSGGSGYVCTCRGGYSGATCAVYTSLCSSGPCLNGAACTDGGSFYQCACVNGYTGTRCEQYNGLSTVQPGSSLNGVCSIGSCVNGGTCYSSSAGTFKCACMPGFGGSRCEININECVSNPCLNGGTCVDGANEFVCRCPSGWSGATCSQTYANCDPNPCKHGGRCFALSITTYVCKCADGYLGTQCENDVNECDYSICPTGATCVNNPGSYQCLCPSGSSTVVCAAASSTTSTTTTTIASATGCSSSPCRNGGTCFNYSGRSFSCQCPNGYSGTTCEIGSSTNTASCNPNPCSNNGVCALSGSTYSCTCLSGYSGTNCQYSSGVSNSLTSSTSCSPNCQNGGACVIRSNGGGYACNCTKGYTGSSCTVPCPNGWSWSNGACYFAVDVSSNYDQAVSMCPRQQAGSYLLTVESQSEFDNAAILMNQLQSNIWMGLKYDVSRAQFVWITGQMLGVNDFKAWAPQQPNNPQTKNCARITANAGFVWEMEDCNRSLKLICKYKGL